MPKITFLGVICFCQKDQRCFFQIYGQPIFKTQKINVWDLNGKKYIDFVFAVGQSTLGYANSTIDSKVKKQLREEI